MQNDKDKLSNEFLEMLADSISPDTHCCECWNGIKHSVCIQYPDCDCDLTMEFYHPIGGKLEYYDFKMAIDIKLHHEIFDFCEECDPFEDGEGIAQLVTDIYINIEYGHLKIVNRTNFQDDNGDRAWSIFVTLFSPFNVWKRPNLNRR